MLRWAAFYTHFSPAFGFQVVPSDSRVAPDKRIMASKQFNLVASVTFYGYVFHAANLCPRNAKSLFNYAGIRDRRGRKRGVLRLDKNAIHPQ
jgi:hypothetical protein